MKTITCLIIFSLFFNCSAQELLKIKEVFDFESGDIFQYIDYAYPQPNRETIEIISKSYSNNEDSVIYTAKRHFYFKIPDIDTISIEKRTIQLIYTNLDSSIFDFKPEYKYDSLIKDGRNLDYYDTIIEYNTDLCNEFVNGYRFLDFEFFREYLFGKGIGIVEEMIPISDSPGECNKCRELVYYRKSDKSCGDYDITNFGNTHLYDCKVKYYPNPAKDYVYFNFMQADVEGYKINLYNFFGKIVISKELTDGNKIDVSDLPIGSYILSIDYKDKNESHLLNIQ